MLSGKIIGAEALARWVTADNNIIMPDKFINVAEETFQIIDIGKQITETVLTDINACKKMHCEVPISINVSTRQFSNNAYFAELIALLELHNVKPGMLELEITEQIFLGDLVIAKQRLENFRRAGFRISLDDFGTGYSSMSYLHDLPIDILKIDKSFINGLSHNHKSLAIMKSISSLSRDLNYLMIAEGVETEEQKNILLDLNCIYSQGYYFYRPMPMKEFVELLKNQNNL